MSTAHEVLIRDAASILVVRDPGGDAAVLMGQRGAKAAFMPSKFVFPGGAVDPDDDRVPLASPVNPRCAARLDSTGLPAATLAAAAIRELWEETGLLLGTPGVWPSRPPPDWSGFAARGMVPQAGTMQFVFRAITPPGRSRRFDARFLMVDADALQGDPDDFSGACEELAHLQWVPLARARSLDLPFVTEVVLAEAHARLRGGLRGDDSVPFFDNSGTVSAFQRIA